MKILKNTLLIFGLILLPNLAFSSSSVGTIDASFKLTKICQDVSCTTFGNANWKPTLNAMTPGALPVTISDTSITGHVWGDQIGWINLAPTGAGIFVNPTTGLITGKAFASGGSWINFNPTGQSVALVDNGTGSNFFGWAWVSGPYGGWMNFDCSGLGVCIKTDWRTIPNRPVLTSGGGGGGGSIQIIPSVNNVSNLPQIQIPLPVVVPPNKITPTETPIKEKPYQNTKPNTFDKNNDGEPDIAPTINTQIKEQDDSFVRQVFPINQKTYQEKQDCQICIIVKKEKVNITVDNKKSENRIIKIGFVPKSFEKPIYIAKKTSPEGNVVKTSLDMTSVLILMISLWVLRKLVAITLS
jgi:hypothetical protein